MKFLSLLQKRGLSYVISIIPLPSPKNIDYHLQFMEFLSFSKTLDYHMQFLEFLSLLKKHGLSYAIFEFLFLPQKRGLSYAISGISFPSPKTWTIICNF